MSLELTVSVTTLVLLVGFIWKAACWTRDRENSEKSIIVELRSSAQTLTVEQTAIKDDLREHVHREEENFRDFRNRFHVHGNTLTEIKLAHSELAGRVNGLERAAK